MEEEFGRCEAVAQKYRSKCLQLYSLATIFIGDDVPKVNGLEKQPRDEPSCDGTE